jgi:signal transduction histidine kinase
VCPADTVCIVTPDQQLFRACAEVLASWQIPNVVWADEDRPVVDSGLIVHDSRAGRIPDSPETLRNCMFLVERAALVNFPADILLFAAAVALLPCDAARLSIAFEQAFARRALLPHSRTANGRTDKDALLQCLLQANLKLQEYDQDRTTFLNRALHDFRAPLTSITGYCGLLLSGQAGTLDTRQSDLVHRIENSAKRLSRLSNGMFQLGVRRFKEMKPELVKGDLHAALEIAMEEVDALVQQKHLTLSALVDEPDTELLFEPEQIVQVLVNILENACRFTPKRSTIHIRGYSYFWERRSRALHQKMRGERRARHEPSPNAYRVDISDAGPGILPEHLASIFEEYTSYAGGKDRSGTGLGLAISKGIIEMHEGRIWAEARRDGATFSFVLPYAIARSERRLAYAAGSPV